MNPTPSANDIAIQTVYLSILAIFMVLTTVSWLIASKDWFKEDEPVHELQNDAE